MNQPPILAIANRGEVAIRIARTAARLGWNPVVLLGDADLDSLAARTIGNVARVESELDPDAVVHAALRAGATALHPGYGFLSERPELAAACNEADLVFIGPSAETLTICGDKLATREAAIRAGVPLLPASDALGTQQPEDWTDAANSVGYPLMVKVTNAGGGRGLRVARSESDLEPAVRSALNEAGGTGADVSFYFERYLEGARHVEVQVAGDGEQVVALGDRDCSLQRRHQKVIEEAPAPGLEAETRRTAHRSAVAICEEVGLKGVATVEFLLGSDGTLAFIEVNPRLQVEHTVTEEVTGLDLVEVQLRIAAGNALPSVVAPQGHAIQARLYAEDASREFLPSPGEIAVLDLPDGIRIDAGFAAGDTVTSGYDPMIAKLIAHGATRDEAISNLTEALTNLRIAGIATNRPWLLALLANVRFRENTHNLATAGDVNTPLEPPPANDLALLASRPAPTGTDAQTAWQRSGAFRIAGEAMLAFHGIDDEWQTSVPVRSAAIDEPGSIVLDLGGSYELSTPRGRWQIAPGARPAAAVGERASDGNIQTPMPGTLLSVDVEIGDSVSAGQVVAVMSAMKIEISLAAPFDGEVSYIGAAAGELVGSKQTIVTITAGEQSDD